MTTVDCACLIHGDKYNWSYVDTLYHMICRNVSMDVRFHVYTEASRGVPSPFIKHELIDWSEEVENILRTLSEKAQIWRFLHVQRYASM